LEIQNWPAFGLILGLNDLPGFIPAGGMQAGAPAGSFGHAIIHPATDAAKDEAITSVHFVHAHANIK
jgi:hypothetical protein